MAEARKMSEIVRRSKKDLNDMQREMSKIWGTTAFEAMVDTLPRKGETKYATGRSKASVKLTKNGEKFDAGVRPAYPEPRKGSAAAVVRSMNLNDNLILTMGTPYAKYVAKYYDHAIKAGMAGEIALERNEKQILEAGNSS